MRILANAYRELKNAGRQTKICGKEWQRQEMPIKMQSKMLNVMERLAWRQMISSLIRTPYLRLEEHCSIRERDRTSNGMEHALETTPLA